MTVADSAPVDANADELSSDECRTLLGLGAVGRVGFVEGGLPVILPVNYRLVNDESGMWILLRTRPGHTIDKAPELVAFEIDGIDHEHHHGWSVLVRGALHHLDHNEIELFTKRFDPKPWPQQDRSSWIAIKAHDVTGRKVHAAEHGWTFPSRAPTSRPGSPARIDRSPDPQMTQ